MPKKVEKFLSKFFVDFEVSLQRKAASLSLEENIIQELVDFVHSYPKEYVVPKTDNENKENKPKKKYNKKKKEKQDDANATATTTDSGEVVVAGEGQRECPNEEDDVVRPVAKKAKKEKKSDRVKHSICMNDRCTAKKGNEEQCSRKRKAGSEYCGTHCKGTPNGVMGSDDKDENGWRKIHLFAQEIQGILYYMDDNNNVYQAEDVVANKINPKIIARYERIGNILSIPSLGLSQII